MLVEADWIRRIKALLWKGLLDARSETKGAVEANWRNVEWNADEGDRN